MMQNDFLQSTLSVLSVMRMHIDDAVWLQEIHWLPEYLMVFQVEILQSLIKPIALVVEWDWNFLFLFTPLVLKSDKVGVN